MRLTKFTDLALRVVLRLAQAGQAEQITGMRVAVDVGASHDEMIEIVARLRALDLLDCGGGERMALTERGRAASVGWLARELEGDGEVVGCDDDPPCPMVGSCRLRGALRSAREAFYATLDPILVRDLATNGRGPVPITIGRPRS